MATSIASGRLEELLVEDMKNISGVHTEFYDVFGNLQQEGTHAQYTLQWSGVALINEPFVEFEVTVSWRTLSTGDFEHTIHMESKRYLRN